jgi:prepilin-type processing-associated H-X9-DG protein
VAAGFLILVIPVCLLVVLYPVFAPAKSGNDKFAACLSNLKQTSTATFMYMSDHDGRMPLATWIEGLSPDGRLRYFMGCPLFTEKKEPYGFALKSGLVGMSETRIRPLDTTVMILETDIPGDNVIADLSKRSARHKGASNVVFFDGHARLLPPDAPLQ